jgi:hypothetical protein
MTTTRIKREESEVSVTVEGKVFDEFDAGRAGDAVDYRTPSPAHDIAADSCAGGLRHDRG